MPNVLILGGRAPVALDHARRFAQQGWCVHVADSIACRLSGWSRSVSSTVRLASPRDDGAGFAAGLNAAITRHAIDLVVPTCEEVFYLSRHRAALPASCRVLADDFGSLRRLHSKWDFQTLARECGGRPPASAAVQSIGEARDWAAGQPLVLKPEFSRFGVHVRLYPHGVPDLAPPLAAMGRWVAQHFCSGTELCSYSVADRGRLLAHAVYRPQHRLSLSASYYFAHHHSPAIRAFVDTLVARIGFTGQISFDWIDPGNDSPQVIECNPRAISGVHLFGMDDALPAALSGTHDGVVVPGHSRARMLAPVMLTAGLAQALRQGRLAQWRADFRAADDVLARPGDISPCAGGLADIAAYTRLAFQRGCTLREAATRDIEWDGDLPAAA